jgi:TetR/AcrR family transcriptional regulator, regulator of cefoperazone and chloramphenicol sensitivity
MAKTQEKVEPRKRILDETIHLIGKECKLKFTTRELSKRADVNLASINYYYNSKNQLVNQAEEFFTTLVDEAYAELGNSKRTPRENLIHWADHLVKTLIEYPGIMYVWSWKVIIGKQATTNFLELFYSSENPVTKMLSKAHTKAKPEMINFKSIQLVSDILNPFVFHQGPKGKKFFDMTNEKSRKQYIELAVDSALN